MKFPLSALVATSIVFGSFAVARPVPALASDGKSEASAPAAASDSASVETRIKELHDKLKISQTQEDLWGKVTQEMRDSAKAVHELAAARTKNAPTMSAIEDLKSYAEIAKLHAEGMSHFVEVFAPLYNNMSDDQKKNADEVFRGHKDARAKKHQASLKQ